SGNYPDVVPLVNPRSEILFLKVYSFAFWSKVDERGGLAGFSVAERNVRSVAILPLRTLGEREINESLSLGLADSLISRLGSLNRFAVRPLNSVKAYADGNDPLKFGQELKVDAILEGTLQTIDSRLRLNMRLLDVRDGAQLWQGSFDETKTDLFKLQDALSLQVTESLTSKLNQNERALLTKRDTENREAFHSYWRGRFFLEKRDAEKAMPEFQHAIRLDPNYALAYAGLADAYSAHASLTSGANVELYDQARALAEKALSLDPALADAHTSLARIRYLHDWDWAGAEKSFRRALELNPNSVNAHQFYAPLLATLGRYPEALAEVHKARELDPRSTDLAIPLFAILEKRGEFDEALKVVQASLEMDKDSRMAKRGVGKANLLKGEYAKVIELGNRHFPNPKEADFAWASMLATAYRKIGPQGKAAQMQNHLRELAATDSKSLYFLAMHYSETGRAEEAVAALQQCFELREERMVWTKDEPRFAALKDDSRLRAILQKMNLTN
ncbi:MAG: tetratricopeptide repeat protein, partial [Acidobacteriota bacterium]|nr:tetratricopeptide repeat protein [Acidobacteriota bacterium]